MNSVIFHDFKFQKQESIGKMFMRMMFLKERKFAGKAAAGIVAAFCLLCGSIEWSEAATNDNNLKTFENDVAELTTNRHRLAGWAEGSRAAAAYIERRLDDLGLDDVLIQEFPVVQNRSLMCEIEVDGETFPMQAARHNMLQAAITPKDGLTAETIYAGNGLLADYDKKFPEDKIVVMDFDSDDNWLNAFAMGARAVIFIGGPDDVPLPRHHVNLPANLPRFYVTQQLAEKLRLKQESRKVTLRAFSEWEEVEGRNVFGILRGTDPVVDEDDERRETIVLGAPLDALSEIPELSQGARNAGNCAALLHLARHFKENRPRRDIIFAFFDGEAQNHLGARAFYGALYRVAGDRPIAKYTLKERMAMIEEEIEYMALIQEVLETDDVFSEEALEMEGYSDFSSMLRNYVVTLGNVTMQELAPLRVRYRNLKSSLNDLDADKEKIRREMDELKPETGELGTIDRLAMEDLAWNSILRFISEQGRPGSRPEVKALAQELITESDPEKRIKKREYFVESLFKNVDSVVEYARDLGRQRQKELVRTKKHCVHSLRLAEEIGREESDIVLHLSLNLGDARKKWCFAHGDDSMPFFTEDEEGNYRTILYRTIRNLADEVPASDKQWLDLRSVSTMYPSSRMFTPGLHTDSGVIAGMFSRFNMSLNTVFDPLRRHGLPSDTLENLDVGAMYAQSQGIAGFLSHFVEREELSRPYFIRVRVFYNETRWSKSRRFGHAIKQSDVGDPMRSASVPGAVVALFPRGGSASSEWSSGSVNKVPPGFSWPILRMSQSDGIFELPPISREYQRAGINPGYFAARFDAGEVMEKFIRARGAQAEGIILACTTKESMRAGRISQNVPVEIANVKPFTLVGYGYDRLVATTVMRAASTAELRADRHLLCEYDTILTLFSPLYAKGVKLFNPYGTVLLQNSPTKNAYQGAGYSLADPFSHPVASRTTAEDLYTLNEYRLNLLRENKIGQESLEVIHGSASDLNADAKSQEDSSRYMGMLEGSSSLSRRVYDPLIGVMNDLVTAVVFLLVLAIPFAYSMERLLIGTPNIYKKIGWFVCFFLVTFGLLYLVNPAFKLAATPLIIFLAFAIILLSTLVIFIMTRKLESEIKKMQGVSASAHSMDVSRLSTMTAAIAMGISTMRRRPLRTLLTCITVVLLTFTILSFASFGSSWGNRRTYVGPMRYTPSRVLVHNPLWNPIKEDVTGFLAGFMKGTAEVVPRYWLSPEARDISSAMETGGSVDRIVSTEDGEKSVIISAAMGMDIRDIEMQPHLRRLLQDEANVELLKGDGMLLANSVSKSLGLSKEDIGNAGIILEGRHFTYAGTIATEFAFLNFMDGSSMLPVDYKASVSRDALSRIAGASAQEAKAQEGQAASFVTYSLDSTLIISAKNAAKLGGKIRAITAYPKDSRNTQEVGENVAKASGLPTFVGNKGAVHRLLFGTLIQASGLKDLVIPVLLGGLIVFATMLGSVADREGEIYSFSALGLAPAHIAGLFFAEAAVYAVVGGMGGYLLGQVVTEVLSLLSNLGWFSVPSMNFSSMNAIVTIFTVMAIVLLSTVYPAIKGARAANPGIQRSWRISSPVGGVYDIAFPFTVSEYDLTGIVSFIEEHFNNYRDTSVGDFATMECRVIRQKENDMLGIEGYIALAPFDLGIEQNFIILSRPSDIEGIDEIRVLLKRKNGAYGDWQRANKVFISGLRKQFLIWRTFGKELTDHYREMTHRRWDELAVISKADIDKQFSQEETT